MNKKYLIYILLLGFVLSLIYFNIFENSPTDWDDPSIFSGKYDQGITTDNLKRVLTYNKNNSFQPIRDISYMIDFSLWKKNVVFGLHLQNLIWYFIMVLALWLFLLELFKAFGIDDKKGFIWASASALIFAVHPVHSEAVAWLMARKEPLMGTFSFLCLWTFLKARKGDKLYFYSILSLIFLVLAILSKPIAVMLPAVLIMLDLFLQNYKPQAGFWKKRIIPCTAILLVAVVSITGLLVLVFSAGVIKLWHGGTFFTNLFAVSQILISYIFLIGLTFNYCADYPIKLYVSISDWQAWAYILMNLIIIGVCVFAFFKKRYLITFFIAWFYIFLIPVSHIFPIYQKLADRYALMSSLSWCVMLGFILTWPWDAKNRFSWLSRDFLKLAAYVLFAIILLSYSAITIRQNSIWKNSITLWSHTLDTYPNSNPANTNLSSICIQLGQFEQAKKLALNAIREEPYDYNSINNLSIAQMFSGEYDQAINNFKVVLALKPDLYISKLGLAEAYWKKGMKDDSVKIYLEMQKAGISFVNEPTAADIYCRLAYSEWKSGQREKAMKLLDMSEKAIKEYSLNLFDIGNLYLEMEEKDKAIALYKKLMPQIKNKKDRETLHKWILALMDPGCTREAWERLQAEDKVNKGRQ